MPHGTHHMHKRKRVHQDLEPYPHPDKWKRYLDKLLLVIAIITPFNVVPQIIKIYVYKTAEGVAATTWGMFAMFNVLWVAYGLAHREYPIIVGYCLLFVVNITVFVGTFLY